MDPESDENESFFFLLMKNALMIKLKDKRKMKKRRVRVVLIRH